MSVHGRLNECPAKVWRSGLGEFAAAVAIAGRLDGWVESRQAGDLLSAAEAARLTDLGEEMAGEDRPDSVDRLQAAAAIVSTGEAAQLGVDRVQLCLERSDDREQRINLQPRCSGSFNAAAQRSPSGVSSAPASTASPRA